MEYMTGTVTVFDTHASTYMGNTSTAVVRTEHTNQLVLCDGTEWAAITLDTALIEQLIEVLESKKTGVVGILKLTYIFKDRCREGFVLSIPSADPADPDYIVLSFLEISDIWGLVDALTTIQEGQADRDRLDSVNVPAVDYVVGNSHTFQSRHWLDKDTSVTVVGTDYLILNDGRQSAVIALNEKVRQDIVEILSTDLKAGYGYKEGRTLGELEIMCTTRDEPYGMKWLELSVGEVTVYLEKRDVPALADLLGGT